MSNLPVSRLVNVSVVLSAIAAQAQNLSTLLVLTSTAIIDVVERLRTYNTLVDVATDFGTTGPEYAAALLWFGQSPQPKQFKVGRWAKTASAGALRCAPLTTANKAIAAWNAITTGAFKIGIDAVAPVDVTGMNFTTDANLNAVAARIQAAVRAANAGFVAATVVYNATYNRFEFNSGTTGASSKVTFAAAAGTGTDISVMLGARSTSSGAYVADGIALETALAAATLFDAQFGQTWYGLVIPEAADADQVLVASFIEATNNKHLYGITSQDAAVLSTVSTTDVPYQVMALSLKKTITQYSSSNPYAVVSLLARALPVDYTGNNTVITLMYKQEPLIVAENLLETQMTALASRNCNVFVAYNNATAIIEKGQVAGGDFIDTITGADAFAIGVMNAVYNLLYTSTTKIPQTDEGTHLLVTTIEAVCIQFRTNGYLAPGVWDQSGFGTLKQGDFLAKGFYVYAPPVALQAQADRQARKSVSIQVAGKCAGAIHTANVVLNISR